MDLNNKKFHHNTPMKYLETYLHIPIVPINLQSPICGNIQRHMVSFKSQVRHRMNSIFSLLPMGITFVSKHLACSPTLLVPTYFCYGIKGFGFNYILPKKCSTLSTPTNKNMRSPQTELSRYANCMKLH